jgi:hypothetical protein
MNQLALLWSDTPRWVRGWVLGNICYLLVLGVATTLTDWASGGSEWLLWVAFVFLWPVEMGAVFSHTVWCVLGALFVRAFGEVKGIGILLILMTGIGILVIAFFLITFVPPIF